MERGDKCWDSPLIPRVHQGKGVWPLFGADSVPTMVQHQTGHLRKMTHPCRKMKDKSEKG